VTDEERALRAAWLVIVAAIVAVAGAGALIGRQATRPLPALSLTANLVSVTKPGGASFTWPSAREAAVTVSGLATSWATKDQPAVPIASVTKIMTAYLVLRDHPLAGDDQGPSITVTQADVQTYQSAVANGESNAKVAAGEKITEREALEALMLPSANNVAILLANWDAGSRSAFQAKMNASARALGMKDTRYTDPSGRAETTVSTARDQLVLVRQAMAIPAFADIVAMPSAVIPVAGTIRNFANVVGTNGIIGVKTGSDNAAQACWAFAARRAIAGRERVVYGVVLGAPLLASSPVANALQAGQDLADQAHKVFQQVTVLPAGTIVGRIKVPWTKATVPVVTARPLAGIAPVGTPITLRMSVRPPSGAFPAGQQVGTVSVNGLLTPGSTALVSQGASGSPALLWKVMHP
jgi:serine-type D-Ala-D-Ala carboxypeptidase (penicillin-binding protein 5/6)